jgi:predicted O-methyltransferase YrrM
VSIKSTISNLAIKASWHVYRHLQEKIRRDRPFHVLWEKSAHETADFIAENLTDAVVFEHRQDFWRFVMTKLPKDGELIEVGVFKGVSVNFIADALAKAGDKRLVHGFDSFEGLEEDWAGESMDKNFWNQKGRLPNVRPSVRLHKGWVQDTLGPFYAEHGNPKIALIHIDTDTYSPARHILEVSAPLLTPGTVIVFDELIGYPNWQNHEYKALQEVLPRDCYRFIGFTSRRAAIMIVKPPVACVSKRAKRVAAEWCEAS